MKIRLVCLAILLSAACAFAESPRASLKTEKVLSPAAQSALADIKATLGTVPTFLKQFPEEALPEAWKLMKEVQLSDKTAIPPRYKDLIGLAIASQIPCHYCTFFHTEAAKLGGARDEEIKEAVALSASERQWSTFMNGIQADDTVFKAQTDQIMAYIKSEMGKPQQGSESMRVSFNSAQEAREDVQKTLGIVPDFVKQFPEEGFASAWGEVKALLINPNTAIPPKYKDLISLSVAAQIPCQKCIYWDTEAAKVDGASQKEIAEAVAVASLSRHWSTVLNGMQTNDAQFRKEMTEVFTNMRKKDSKPAT